MTKSIIQLLEEYRSLGSIKAGELLLLPEDAIRLADDLKDIDIPIIGVDIWYVTNGLVAEDPFGLDLSSILKESEAVSKSITIAKDYIKYKLPDRIQFVSFVIDDQGWGSKLE